MVADQKGDSEYEERDGEEDAGFEEFPKFLPWTLILVDGMVSLQAVVSRNKIRSFSDCFYAKIVLQ